MAKAGMRRPKVEHPREGNGNRGFDRQDTPVPEIQGKAKSGKDTAKETK